MRIYQVVPYYPPHVGGMEFYVQRLSEELVTRGHDVTVFTSTTTVPSITMLNGVKIVSLKQKTKLYNVPIVPSLFKSLMDAEKPDILHTHQYPIFFSDISASVATLRDIPLIVQVHVISDAKSVVSGLLSKIYYSTIGLRTLKVADGIIVPSAAYKRKLEEMYLNANIIEIVPYGIDTAKFLGCKNGEEFKERYHCKGNKIILSVGRLNYQKGFHYLIKAMPAVIRTIPNVKLIIVGEGEQLLSLKQLVKSVNLEERVIFTGPLSQNEIPNAYSAADIFVLPSIFESFGISLIEAQAAGKPVIGTRTGGTPEALVCNETGSLVEPRNPGELARELIRILSDKELACKMGMSGQRFVQKRFDNPMIIAQIVNSYEAIIAQKTNK